MLEKIGLPPKPSLRGNSWVVDASHCQGCASQFTFINRKHHCRRCGGIFCGSCTQQRMVLRGQGDSPVRICEPCKNLEEAARFEMRQGYKNRAAKGSSKLVSKKEDDSEGKGLSSASCSNVQQTVGQVEGGDIARNLSLDQPTNFLADLESTTPEELREQALVEKKKYRTLKAEGKSEEALRAFKKGKELERQAGALDITLRKNRKKALSSSNRDDVQHIKDHFGASAEKVKLSTEKSKEKDDLSAELKELGWSDADLRDAEKRPATLTVEGELSSLLREVPHKPGKEKQAVSTDKSQVIAHKKKALELKRAGNLLEAKEELKRAKILERKIEEEELLGGSDDSDDELSLLMRSMESDEHEDLSSRYKSDLSFDVNHLVGIANDLGADGNFDVTDEDMEDPEIAYALKSLGWADDTAYSEDFPGPVSSSSRESLLTEVQSLKREAVNQKRAGNAPEAMALLKKAKVLEMELQPSDNQGSEFIVPDSTTAQKTSVSHSLARPFSFTWENSENIKNRNSGDPKLAPKSKLTIQKELIALKKKALTLRREGRLDESEEELKKAKVLEEQLQEINEAPTVAQQSSHSTRTFMSTDTAIEDGDEEEVTDQDLNDPTYLSLLKNLGWEEEDNVKVPSSTSKENDEVLSIKSKENVVAPNYASNSSVMQSIVNVEAATSRKSKSEIQRELLALKRKAFTLRRQGETEAADEVLKNARSLEIQLQEYEEPTQRHISSENGRGKASFDALQNTKYSLQVDAQENKLGDSRNQVRLEKPEEILSENDKLYIHNPSSSQVTDSQPHSSHLQQEILADKKLYDHELDSSKAADSQSHTSSLQQEILGHKRKALSLKREGKMAEAKEELRLAKLLEKRVEDASQTSTNAIHAPVSEVPSIEQKEASPSSGPKMLSSRERFKLQQESLGHKRQALKLRREGKIAEADAEFELAKALETQLQEPDHDSTGSSKSAEPDDVSIEDFLDPQLLSALQSIGLEDPQATTKGTERLESTNSTNSNTSNPEDANIERKQLGERIKAEKLKAVNLKRAGKQAEALDALRRAKLYEKKLQSLNSN